MKPIRVAMVEDDAGFAKAIAVLLDLTPGFQWVATFGTIAEMVSKVCGLAPQVALVDLELPDGPGEDAIRRLGEMSPTTKPIVLSKFDQTTRIFDAIGAGALGYVLKTDGGREILDAIEAVHRGQGGMSPSIARKTLEWMRQQTRPEVSAGDILTEREREVLELAVQGLPTKDIAGQLKVSRSTISNHLTEVYRKLHVTKRSELPGYRRRPPKG